MDWYVLAVNPEPWAIGDISVGRKGKGFYPIVGRNQQLHAYKEAVKEALNGSAPNFRTGKLRVCFWFWRNRAEYTTSQARTHRKHEADTTNLVKSTEDACQGILFNNDKDNVEVHGFTVAQGAGVVPLVVICVEEVDPSSMEHEALSSMPQEIARSVLGHQLASRNAELLIGSNEELGVDPTWTAPDEGDF